MVLVIYKVDLIRLEKKQVKLTELSLRELNVGPRII
jgi:hypothetical protein